MLGCRSACQMTPGRLPDDAGARLTGWALVGRTGRRDADWRDGAPDHAHRLGLRETPSFGSESGGADSFLHNVLAWENNAEFSRG